ncbi:MAG: PD-(D/E)XK nuclease family protein, partial [Arenibacterium sp.]
AAGELDNDGHSWYQQVAQAMRDENAIERTFPGGTGLCIEDADWNTLPLIETDHEGVVRSPALPNFFDNPAPEPVQTPEVLSPSDLGGAKALSGADGDDEETAKRRGTRIHALLEHLPDIERSDWDRLAATILPDVESSDLAAALAEAKAVLEAPHLRHLFSPENLSEVPITAEVGGRRIHGVIDRLIVTDRKATVVDFKSNAVVPTSPESCPDGLLRQMGAYALQLQQIYPERTIETAILWTRTATLMPLPYDIVIEALNHTPHLDLGTMRS